MKALLANPTTKVALVSISPTSRQNRPIVNDFGARAGIGLSSTLACSQTGLENKGANSTINGNNSAGSVCNLKTSRGKSGLQLTLSAVVFSKIKNGQSRDNAADDSLEIDVKL